MAKRTHPFGNRTLNARAGEVRGYYKDIRLDEFTRERIVETAPAVAEITVRGRGVQYDVSGRFRLVNFDQQQNPIIHGYPGGAWFIMSWNPWQQDSSGDAGDA